MPGIDGTGPAGAEPMTGRGQGVCGGARAAGWGFGRGLGRGFGPGRGFGRGLGWFAVGYGEPGQGTSSNIRAALEERRAFLLAELKRTESLLESAAPTPDKDAGKA